LGISDKSLYVWLKQKQQLAKGPRKNEVLALKNEISRTKTEALHVHPGLPARRTTGFILLWESVA
jgi:hypothetical protein